MASDEAQRVTLEGRAELLERAVSHAAALLGQLRSPGWSQSLREQPGAVWALAALEDRVREALALVERRALADGWSAGSPVRLLHERVTSLRAELQRQAGARLGAPARGRSLAAHLAALVPPSESSRWRQASAVLAPASAQLRAATALAEALSSVRRVGHESLAQVLEHWAPGTGAINALWERLRGAHDAVALEACLRRARPRVSPTDPAGVLIHAERELAVGTGAVTQLLADLADPLPVSWSEVLLLAEWWVRRRSDPEARLSAHERLSDAKAGLFELAFGLNVPGGPAALLVSAAQRADEGTPDPGVAALRARLEQRLRAKAPQVAPLYRLPGGSAPRSTSLAQLVLRLMSTR